MLSFVNSTKETDTNDRAQWKSSPPKGKKRVGKELRSERYEILNGLFFIFLFTPKLFAS